MIWPMVCILLLILSWYQWKMTRDAQHEARIAKDLAKTYWNFIQKTHHQIPVRRCFSS